MTPTDIQRLRALAEKAIELHCDFGSFREEDASSNAYSELEAALSPATVIALCDLAEKAHPEPAQAQVSEAEVEAACVAAYSACDMGSFPAMAVEPDSDRRIIRAALEAAARARGTGEALAGDIARRAIAAQSSAKGVE